MTTEVGLVLDPDFGNRLETLAKRMPVWIVSGMKNCEAVDRARAAGAASITTIERYPGEGLEDFLLRAAYNIEDHHGIASGGTSYAALEVYGASGASCPVELNSELGFKTFEDMPSGGFIARK